MTNSIREAMQDAMKDQGAELPKPMILDEEDESEDYQEPIDTTTAPEGETPEQKTARERDETGKFKTKPKEAKIPPADKQEGTTVPEKGTTGGAPATFSKEEQAQWDNVPPLVRNAISRIENQSQTAVLQAKQELATTRSENAARDTVLEPYARMWMQNGVPVQQGLAIAMKAVHDMERDPVNTIKRLASQYGISLAEEGNDFQDPVAGQLTRLEQQFQQFTQSQSQAQQNVIQQRNVEETSRFVDAKDAQGNLVHPHWERVLPQMRALIPAVAQMKQGASQQEVLKAAYDLACQQNDEVRTEIASSQTAMQKQQEFEQRKSIAEKARQGVVSSAPAAAISSEGQRKGMTIRDSLKQAFSDGLGRM